MALELRLYRVGEIDWQPRHRPSTPKNSPALYEPAPFDQLAAKLGWVPHRSRHPNAALEASATLPETSEYYADLGPAAGARYRFGIGGRLFGIVERPILAAHEPYVFLYPEQVPAHALQIAGGSAVIVLPAPEVSMSFAIWTGDDRLIDISFNWAATLADAQEIVTSVVSRA